jgi:alpha-beta hydrolase superfamily lysophospholipase
MLRSFVSGAFFGITLLATTVPIRPVAAQPAAPPAAAAKPAVDATERLQLETSDGIEVAAWHYPVLEGTAPLGTVILLHDLGGSHRTVEPLAKALQAAGCTVVAPDLRGHGQSPIKTLPAGDGDQSRILKKPDFEMIAATSGGRVREQSGLRGDVECVRNWIHARIAEGRLAKAPLFVVGSGLGASIAASWTAADAMWPDIASGPQGREVAGLVMISPAFATKGYSLAPALATDTLKRFVPVLVIAATDDRDAIKVFDQMKRQRPKEWFDGRHPKTTDTDAGKEASPAAASEATLLLLTSSAGRKGDTLAALRSADPRLRGGDPATLIPGFIRIAGSR